MVSTRPSLLVIFSAVALVLLGVSLVANMSLRAVRNKNAAISLENKRCIVVGGTAGIGYGIAKRLAKANGDVTILGRNAKRGQEIVDELSELGKGKHRFQQVDASSMRNIRTTAKELLDASESVDVLVMTQGIATVQGYTPTDEGIDQKLAIHYFGRVALANALVPALEKAEHGRLLSVLSAGVHGSYNNYKDDFDLSQGYSLKNAADAAGFYNDAAWYKFGQLHPSVSFVHAAPGFVATNWGTELPVWMRGLVRVAQCFAKSDDDCAEFMFEALMTEKKGAVYADQHGQPTTRSELDDAGVEFIWERTNDMIDKAMNL